MKRVLFLLAAVAFLPARHADAMVHEIAIRGFAFDPVALTIAPGDTVTWTNEDSAPHTATADDFSWDTGILNTGESGSVVFDDEGIEDYHCDVHPSMNASLEITGTDIQDGTPAAQPRSLLLDSARPNPFNPHTLLPFTLTREGQVVLTVHDTAGHTVRTLVDAVLGAGSHQVAFDGRNEAGRSLPSGRYVARLVTNGQVETTPLVLLR